MIDNRYKCSIYNEMSKQDLNYWFDLKQKKFLHNIDTFYYSVKLYNDFSRESSDTSCLKLREYFKSVSFQNYDSVRDLFIPGCKEQLVIRPFTFAGFYKINIECPDLFDIFIADTVPTNQDDESVTSEIIVQIRSYMLWTYGLFKSFETSYDAVKSICKYFDLQVMEVKENRIDYCYHTNYLQNPEQYLRIDNFSEMQVSHYRRIHYEYMFKPNDEYENDYICMGNRSDKCFVRIYLKSKEVVEQGYKPFFFMTWLFNGLINRYDLYVMEHAFKDGHWKSVDKYRVQFYSEYGTDNTLKMECMVLLNNPECPSDKYTYLADKLTPRITKIINVEFQTTRRSSKTYCLKPLKDNEKYGECSRIYDYFDNVQLITEYLTHSTLRLVDRSTDTNKSRCDYNAFWKQLRSCKCPEVKYSKHDLKLLRDYTRKLNAELLKKRLYNSVITYGIYTKGINDDDVKQDCMSALLRLNDNDVHRMRLYKRKRLKQFNNMEFGTVLEQEESEYQIVNKITGEIVD